MLSTCKTLEVGPFVFQCSTHFLERRTQRSIHWNTVQFALLNGSTFHKQGLTFHVIGERTEYQDLNPYHQSNCKNIVVVLDENENLLLTVYRSRNPFKHVKKKSKKLNRWSN